jgi:tRNA(Ile)-lysidine synthase
MIESRVRRFLAARSLLDASDRVAVAYSGGPDSTALLLVLRRIHPDTAAIYVNHQLRDDESVREEHFIKDFCASRSIPLVIERIRWRSRPANLEENARKRRYAHLTKAAREHGFTKVALAQHRDDAVETFLQRLMRGSGPRGLGRLASRRGIFIRPFLEIPRVDIDRYLHQEQIPFFTDTSNLDIRFLRNRIRHDLLPLLEKNYNPRVRQALAKAAEWLGEQNELLDELMKPYSNTIREEGSRILMMKKELSRCSDALKKQLLRMALQKADPHLRPDAALLQHLLRLLKKDGENLELPGFLMVKSVSDAIVFVAKTGEAGFHEIDIPGAGSYFFPPGDSLLIFSMQQDFVFTDNPNVAYVDADRAAFPLRARNWKKGDRFHPLGMNGTQKLSDYWIDRKIPRRQRKSIPLIFKDDDLVWVAGHRLSHDFRISETTKRALKIELKKRHV